MSAPTKPAIQQKRTVVKLVIITSAISFLIGLAFACFYFLSRDQASDVAQAVPAISSAVAEGSASSEEPYIFEVDPIQVAPQRTYGTSTSDLRTLSKGFQFQSNVNFEEGGLASQERVTEQSYLADYTLTIQEPKAALSLPDVLSAHPELESSLPRLATLLETATINPYWHELYRRKKKTVVTDAHYLNKLITKHNFYDCQTILNLRDPDTKRRAVLVQADMDVVTDGSDGDRMPTMPEEITTSTYYQPTTSYSWKKTTDQPNPMIAGYRQRIANADQELADAATSADRAKWLKERKKMLYGTIKEMEARSYLIAEHDPFIVLPVPVIVAKDAYSPNVGDYAIVFYRDQAYPAIVGDAGPSYKMGEASLRIARQLDERSGATWRPVSDLSVTYLVFPGTRPQPNQAPNYESIHEKCQHLLSEIGGLGESTSLYQWEDLLAAGEQAATEEDHSAGIDLPVSPSNEDE